MQPFRLVCLAGVWLLLLGRSCSAWAEEPSPWPQFPALEARRPVATITFEEGTAGFQPVNQCRITAEDGILRIESLGDDPYLVKGFNLPGDAFEVHLRMKTSVPTAAAIYWTCGKSPHWGEDKSRHFPVQADGQWHLYRLEIKTPGGLRGLRLDPGGAPGVYEVKDIQLVAVERFPVTIESMSISADEVVFGIHNESPRTVAVRTRRGSSSLGPGKKGTIRIPLEKDRLLEAVSVNVAIAEEKLSAGRTIWVYHPDLPAEWWELPGALGQGLVAEIAPGENVLRVRRNGQTVLVVAPIVALTNTTTPGLDVTLPSLKGQRVENGVVLQGSGVSGRVGIVDGVIRFELTRDGGATELIEGPVVRVLGSLEQGLFAGLEYLGKGERSSSKLDIETEEHLRYVPDRLKVTMPLMAFVTDQVGAALSWDDMQLQPVYATPNVFDGSADHRMSLVGRHIEAWLRLGDQRLEDQILWAVKRKGLPELPEPPRGRDAQKELCLWALTQGPLRNENGWGHCLEPNWVRRFHVDMVSTIWRLSGQVPEVPELVPGGAHLPDEAAWFLTGRAESWLRMMQSQVEGIIRQQQADGSFRYQGPYAKGHYEDTASGYCGRFAVMLLDAAYFLGDRRALEAGLKALEYMKRFRTPRGAQTWELSLHTPDILASAHLVHAYVRGYQLTGRQEYLELARRWALTGIPFVYLWGEYPVMLYGTIPVYGATNWVAPNWMGLPVQWCGLVYAYSLTMLAPLDNTLDWNHLAKGILIAGEQMQSPREEGERAGLLPDSFHLRMQQRLGPFINPCALVNLRLALDGKPHRLEVAANDQHRVLSPFPVKLEDSQAVIQAVPGQKYQIVVDGQRVVSIDSQGVDRIGLD